MKKWLSILPLSLILLLCACQSSDASAQIFAMDTVMDLTVQGSGSAQALKDAEAELYRLDALLSRQDSASAVSALNESAGSPWPWRKNYTICSKPPWNTPPLRTARLQSRLPL